MALGSNVGDRAANLHAALESLAPFAQVDESSFLYETDPAYVTDQPPFLNAVCRARTALLPAELLAVLKDAEMALGRVKSFRFGPRSIDIDLLFYADAILETEALIVPHPRLHERAFVLAPLLDLDPALRHPVLGVSVTDLWQRLHTPLPPRVMPVGDRLWRWGERTFVMGIVNVTPDSFSGDGLLGAGDSAARAVAQARRMAEEGADVLDVGGYSTRPGHQHVPLEEELRRVIHVIRALRADVKLPISVDTFRAEVAAAALEAGARWINDVWGLRLAPQMGELARRYRTPLVLMHNRTIPDQADRLPHLQRGAVYTDVAGEVRGELGEVMELARAAGVPRWLRIGDPGLGFGKSPAQHAELIDRLAEVKTLGYPLLCGASRKGFIGKWGGGLPVEERLPGCLAVAVLAAGRGADIVRVHDVAESVQALRVTDAIIRRGGVG
ncbi:MAG: dihydropteroate synthase [Chloroflexi bacterium]|nr:dihydropteroate synthase [Chloroflexota bacterium]